jgi:APA family basic amino acid/polyamine antiporter
LIWALVAINVAGVRESGIVSLITTILKLTPLILIGVIGLWSIEPGSLTAMNPGVGKPLTVFASVFALTFWIFVGIETATYPAENTVDPSRTLPRALLWGTLTVGVVCFLVALVALGVSPSSLLATADSPLADVGERLFGGVGRHLVVAGAVVSTAGALSASILAGGQVTMAAGRDQVFPESFARLSRRRTPSVSYVLIGLLASLLVLLNFSRGLVKAYEFILLIATLTAVIPYAFTAIACLILRARDQVSTRAETWPEAVIAACAFGVCFWVIAASGMETVYWVFLLIMLGLPLHVLVSRKKVHDESGQLSGYASDQRIRGSGPNE